MKACAVARICKVDDAVVAFISESFDKASSPLAVDGSADTKIGRAWMTLLWRLPMKLI